MKKINGRVNKTTAKKKERTAKEKEFVCAECGTVTYIKHVEFGEDIVCNVCNHKMTEV